MTQLHQLVLKFVIVLVCTIVFQSTTTTWLQVNGGLLGMLERSTNDKDNSMYLYYNNNDAMGYIEDYRSNIDPDGTKPSFLYNTNTSTDNYHRVITYYSHWCGHCIHFRPHYIEIAQQIQLVVQSEQKQLNEQQSSSLTNYNTSNPINTRNTKIKFYAISCVPNSKICSDQNIEYYPSIHIYKQTNNNNTTNTNGTTITTKPDAIISASEVTVDNIVNKYLQLNISTNTIQSIIQQYKTIKQQQQRTKRQQSIQSFTWPSKTKLELYNDIYLSFSFFLRYSIYTMQSQSDDTINNENNNGDQQVHQLLTDAEKHVLLEWFMLLKATIPTVWDKIHTIITILLKDFNTIFENEQNYFTTLDTISVPIFIEKETTSTTTNNRTSNNQQQQQQQQQHRWSHSCSKGIESAGYTCGLWQLLHVVSIGVVENNILTVTPTTTRSTNSSSSSNKISLTITYLPTLYVADIIRSVIEYFFQCEECRNHFVQTYESCAYNRCTRLSNNSTSTTTTTTTTQSKEQQIFNDSIELPLWLIDTHNGVTERLYFEELLVDSNSETSIITTQELSNDEKEIKLWPSKNDCSSCWSKLIILPSSATTTNTSIATGITTTNIQTTLHPKITYEFLKSQYWPSELVDTSEQYETVSTISTTVTVLWQRLLWVLLFSSVAFYLLLRRCLLPAGSSSSSCVIGDSRGQYRSSIHRGTNDSNHGIIVSNGNNNNTDSRTIRNPLNRRKSYQLISQR